MLQSLKTNGVFLMEERAGKPWGINLSMPLKHHRKRREQLPIIPVHDGSVKLNFSCTAPVLKHSKDVLREEIHEIHKKGCPRPRKAATINSAKYF